MRDYRRRWRLVERDAADALRDSGGIGPGRRFEDEDAFILFLLLLMRRHVAGDGLWQRPYLRAAYLRGLQLATHDLRRHGLRNVQDPEDVIGMFSHTADLGALYGQAVHDLNNIQNAATAQTTELLRQARIDGADVDELVGVTSDRLQKIGGTRTKTLANSLVVAGVSAATLNRFSDVGIRLVSAVIEMAFTTAGDEKVCEQCLALEFQDNGRGPGIFTIDEARGIIPVHGNCRCAWTLVVAGVETPFGVPSVVGI